MIVRSFVRAFVRSGVLWFNSFLSNLHRVTLNLPKRCFFPAPDAAEERCATPFLRLRTEPPPVALRYVCTNLANKISADLSEAHQPSHFPPILDSSSSLVLLSQIITSTARRGESGATAAAGAEGSAAAAAAAAGRVGVALAPLSSRAARRSRFSLWVRAAARPSLRPRSSSSSPSPPPLLPSSPLLIRPH